MDLELADVKTVVDEALLAFLARERSRIDPMFAPLVKAAATLTERGGKRIRPAFAVASYLAVAPDGDWRRIAELMSSLEFLQSHLLIQDDLMDEDDLRRGGPSVHRMMEADYAHPHVGGSVALLGSELSLAWAMEVLCRDGSGSNLALVARFFHMFKQVVMGQFLDLVRRGPAETIYALKTASYTVEGPVALGAMLADANDEQRAALDRFAAPVGLAFQLADDILGTFGDAAETGKPVGNDLRRGKQTLVLKAARDMLRGPDRMRLDSIVGRSDASDSDIDSVQRMLIERGVLAELNARTKKLIDDGVVHLAEARPAPRGAKFLAKLARLIAARSSQASPL